MAIKTNMTSLTPRRQVYKKTITLMSHGYNNPKAWPDGQLTVYPWDSAVDNFLLDASRRNPTEALFELLAHVCDLNGGSVDDFVADEVNVVLLVSRALASDNVLVYTSHCPYCNQERREHIQVPDELEKIAEKSSGYPGFDVITLPVCKDEIAIRPLTVKDEKLLARRTAEEQAKIYDLEMRHILPIVTVNNTKPDILDELILYYRALHPADLKHLGDQERALSPHLNSLITHTCENPICRRVFQHLLSFSEEFFRSTGTSKP